MVNFSFNLASVAGIVLAVGGALLYAVRSARPELSRDHDIFFSAVGLLCGLILIFYGWRFDPIMQFGQILLTGSACFFVFENLRLRKATTEQAKRSTPIVDDERPVSSRYYQEAAFMDELSMDDRSAPRRIRGSRDSRPNQDEYEESGRPRRAARSAGDERLGPSDRSRKRRPRSEDVGPTDVWTDEGQDDLPVRPRGSSPSRSGNSSPAARPRRRPPSDDLPRRNRDESSSEYVDYRPVDPDDDNENW